MADPNGTSAPTQSDEERQKWDLAAREMRTRDDDAEIYEDFFTPFQTAVELKAYADALGTGRGHRALEVACGTGRTLGLLDASTVVGIDLSLKELKIAQERFPDATMIQASATDLPFRPGVFDKVLCAGLLLHMPTEEVRLAVLGEMERVSERPARIAIATHAYSWAISRMFARDREEHRLFWHRTSARELESLVKRAFTPCNYTTRALCLLPRWQVGNRLGGFGVWLDGVLQQVPLLKHFFGAIVLAEVDCVPKRRAGDQA